jgi:hypothetical protein
MVERRKKIKRHKRYAIDAETDYPPGIASLCGVRNEHHQTCNRKGRSDQMCNTI